MARAKAEQADQSNEHTSATPTSGSLPEQHEPESNPQSMAEAVLEDIGDEPLVPKRRAGRPKKAAAKNPVFADVNSEKEPPKRLADEPDDDEPVAEDDEDDQEADDTEHDSVATDSDDDDAEPDAREQIRALAAEYGVNPADLDDAETVGEAQRYIRRLYNVFYQQGGQGQYEGNGHTNGHAASEQIPAARDKAVQKHADEDAPDLDFSDYDEDSKTPKNLKALETRLKKQERELNDLRDRDRIRHEVELSRAQQQAALDFQHELEKLSPDLFGDGKRRTPKQMNNLRQAFAVGNQMMGGAVQVAVQTGRPLPPIAALAKQSIHAAFHEELVQEQLTSKRDSVAARLKRRSVGAPGRKSQPVGSRSSGKEVYQGPMSEDPDLLSTVNSWLARSGQKDR